MNTRGINSLMPGRSVLGSILLDLAEQDLRLLEHRLGKNLDGRVQLSSVHAANCLSSLTRSLPRVSAGVSTMTHG